MFNLQASHKLDRLPLVGMNHIPCVKHLTQNLAHRKSFINSSCCNARAFLLSPHITHSFPPLPKCQHVLFSLLLFHL